MKHKIYINPFYGFLIVTVVGAWVTMFIVKQATDLQTQYEAYASYTGTTTPYSMHRTH